MPKGRKRTAISLRNNRNTYDTTKRENGKNQMHTNESESTKNKLNDGVNVNVVNKSPEKSKINVNEINQNQPKTSSSTNLHAQDNAMNALSVKQQTIDKNVNETIDNKEKHTSSCSSNSSVTSNTSATPSKSNQQSNSSHTSQNNKSTSSESTKMKENKSSKKDGKSGRAATGNETPTTSNDRSPRKKGKKRKPRRELLGHPKDDALQASVTEALNSCAPGEEVKAMFYALQPDVNHLRTAFSEIRTDLYTILHRRFPFDDIQIYAFGSTINGLAFKDSDFDIFIRMRADNMPAKKLVYLLSGLMRVYGAFTQYVCVANAKIPILKCFHVNTRFFCDISFSNGTSGMGVRNTIIIKRLLSLDYRIQPLSVILKYWMRTHELSGTGKITNYCLFMLIIFYLQSIPEPVIPSIFTFQSNCPPVNVGFWNVAFDFNYHPESSCQLKVSDLLRGFFEFYKEFDFSHIVVCPLFGRTYHRELFAKNTIPISFLRYIEYIKSTPDALKLNVRSQMCVQDPFNLSHNIAASCERKTFDSFRRELAHAAFMCRDLYKTGESAALLLKLFNEFAPKPATASGNALSDSVGVDRSILFCKLEPIEFELSIIRAILAKRKPNKTVENIDVHREWCEKVVEFVRNIFERLFLFDVKTVDTENGSETKSKKTEGQTDIHHNQYNRVFELHGSYNVYQNRKFSKLSVQNYLKEQEKMSRKIFDAKTFPFDLHCTATLSSEPKFKAIGISFRNCVTGKKNSATKFVFNTFIQKIRIDLKAYFHEYRDECLLNEP